MTDIEYRLNSILESFIDGAIFHLCFENREPDELIWVDRISLKEQAREYVKARLAEKGETITGRLREALSKHE